LILKQADFLRYKNMSFDNLVENDHKKELDSGSSTSLVN